MRLQRLAAERTGRILNTSELARDAGISTATANNYLRYLELSFQVFLLAPFHANPSKRLIKSPCLHWVDVGVWRAVTRRWEGVPGHLYESAIVAEFLKVLQSFRLDWEPFHLRTYDRREIDLLLVRGDSVIPVEIKPNPIAQLVSLLASMRDQSGRADGRTARMPGISATSKR